jgi:hypothetical protein
VARVETRRPAAAVEPLISVAAPTLARLDGDVVAVDA